MKKSEIIATCLVNSSMIRSLEDAINDVRSIFIDEFPSLSFANWDIEIPDNTAQNIINGVGRASRINVKKFIEDLA